MLACCTRDGEVGLEEFDTARGEGTAAAPVAPRLRGESNNSEQGTLPSRATFSSSCSNGGNGRKSPSSFSGQSSSPGMSLQRRSRPPPLLIPDSSAAAHMMGSPSPGATGPGMGREGSHLEGPPYAI